MSASDAPAAVVLDTSADDFVLPFSVEGLDVRGRIVRLGPAIDAILARHAYPDAVSTLLAEAATLAVMLGASLKIEGRFILQTQSDGPVNLLVVDFEMPNRIRACATFDSERVEAFAADQAPVGALLGTGHMAMTIDPGPHASRYQGVVPLDGGSLEEAARLYFRQSEQIPTAVRLAAAHTFSKDRGDDRRFHWRAGGIIVQHLPDAGPGRMPDLHPGDVPEGVELPDFEPDFEEVDEWNEARLILETVEDHELIDPSISAGNLLIRLYHERGVRVFDPTSLIERCRCSQERITEMLRGFSDEERADMVKDEEIIVTCEFCSTRYHVDPSELERD